MPTNSPNGSAPTVAGDRVSFGVRGDGVPGGRPPRLVAGKYLIFGTDQNYLYVMEEVF